MYGVLYFGAAIAFVMSAITTTAVAGDLLRGGFTAAHSGSSAPGTFTPPSLAQARQNAKDVLARATTAVQSVTAMQAAARAIALTAGNNLGVNPNNPTQTLPNVPNGLGIGGLLPTGGVATLPAGWTGVKSLTQSQSAGKTMVTVAQNSPDAVLTWTSFNIGKQTTLDFNQSAAGVDISKWIAFNIVNDPSGVPSQILGSIKAGGQVYVIDQNGIIFGGASQVNVHTLVASSLPIDTALISRGLLNNPDDQFLFSALAQPAGGSGTPAFTPPASSTPSGADGDVTVMAGAQIIAPSNADNVGGRVVLVGPNVTNNGSIITPDGQTILAAGLQVGLIASSDPTLRGLDVFVGPISAPSYPSSATAGDVTNNGSIYVPRGDAMMVGAKVNQMGTIASTTSVTLSGRIDLLADYNSVTSGGEPDSVSAFLPQSTGAVVLGPNSLTDILPELSSAETVVGTALALSSEVNLQGLTIHMEGGSTLLAPDATISAEAGVWNFLLQGGDTPQSYFVLNGGQIFLDSNAEIYAAGSSDVDASVTQNIISAQLLGPQLADSPSQRSGVLRGQTINVDIRNTGVFDGQSWVGTPLADISGYVGLIQYTVGELTINGGTVNLNAGGSVVMQAGSQVNVSGGWIDYQGGVVSTSEVISGGHIFPISQATPDMVYQGFNLGTFTVDHPTYGISQTFTDPIMDTSHFEDSYVNGGNGGSINISAPSVALDGQMIGQTVDGPRQRSVLSTVNSLAASSLPGASTLSIAFQQQENIPLTVIELSPTPPHVVFSNEDDLPSVAAFSVDSSGNPAALPAARQDEVILSPELFTTGGFGALNINDGDGNVTIPSDVTLDPGPHGSITISAANLDIEGSILAPDGNLGFTVFDFTPFGTPPSKTPPVDPTRGHFVLGSGATLDTSGLIVDDRAQAPDAGTGLLLTSGGSVSIKSYSADLEAGSVINVSGGVEMTTSGKPAYGNGGSITIAAGQDPGLSPLIGGVLTLDSLFEGYSGATGGSLSILAPLVQIGGVASHPDTLTLAPDFFSTGGFSSFAISGLGEATGQAFDFIPGLVVTPGTQVDPVITSLIAMPNLSGNQIELVPMVLPVGTRAPVSLTLQAKGVTDPNNTTDSVVVRGDLVIGAGASIDTDPGASVTLKGNTVAVLGSIIDPGGNITISGAGNSVNFFSNGTGGLPTVDIGPHSVISAAGTTLLTPNPLGYHTGIVLNGGSITVTGNIVAEAGAVLDVSGATATLDVTPVQADVNASPGGVQEAVQNGSFLGMVMVPVEVDSSGGSITITGAQELFTDATLRGAAGGPSAIGGSLSISSGAFISNPTPLDPTLVVTQNGSTIPVAFYPAGQDAIGHAVVDKHGNPIAPMGYFAANTFESGGFNSLTLGGSVEFSGPVTITAPGSLTVATGGVIFANSAVNLSANYVALGLPFQGPIQPQFASAPFTAGGSAFLFTPTFGPGSLTVSANLIDIGNLSLQGIGTANFIADGGDIRGDGTLDVAGSIYMRAGQIYVPTEVNFTIAAYDYQSGGSTHAGSITFAASGERDLPLSAGGVLDVYATNITQDGVLRAPLGSINLGWDGAGTAPVDAITGQAVDVTQNLTLGAGSITSVSAVDPVTGQALTIPFGTNPTGTSWIDPSGLDITAGGVPQKSIAISAVNVNDEKGATIDIRGGGDILAYQFVPGIGGSADILGSTTSFAIVPGYQATYAPYATVSGYVNTQLVPGDQIYLNGSGVLPAGVYTLLPARYALLPGAILVTPQTAAAVGATQILPDGGSLVSGYRVAAGQSAAPLTKSFELDAGTVLSNLAQYTTYSGNTYLAQGAILNSQKVPRLPRDSGELSFQALQSLAINGAVQSTPLQGGLGGLVAISSPDNILIGGPGASSTAPNTLVLNSDELSSFGAASLLIGGVFQAGANGTTVDVTTSNITVDNSGNPLTESDIILACTQILTVAPGAELESSGAGAGVGAITVAGNGALLRVSGDPGATVSRTGVTTPNAAQLTVGAGAKISGESVTLDSSGGMSLDPTAVIDPSSIALNSGQITVELNNPGTVAPTTGLVISGALVKSLFANVQTLSLLSYSSFDIYGTGSLGAVNSTGEALLQNLNLSAAEIRGFNSAGGTVTVSAKNITLQNSANATSPGPTASAAGTLVLNADQITLGANAMAIDQYATVNLTAAKGMSATASSGALAVSGGLNIITPFVTGLAGVKETISAAGALVLTAPAATATPSGGLGASLTFIGASVTDNTAISLPTGSITLHATSGDVTVGNLAATSLDVSGQAQAFFDVTKYTNGGTISLIADQGNVSVGSQSTISVAAQSGGGNAGTFSISAPDGTVTLAGNLQAQGGAGGQSGNFSLDVGSLAPDTTDGNLPSLKALDAVLDAAAFDQARTIRVRTGDVFVDGLATTADFNLSVDTGNITVGGEINAAGQTGGAITLQAGGSVTLLSGATLTVAAQDFSAAQKGGSVDLEAGSEVNGVASSTAVVDIQAGSMIDLSVADSTPAAGDLTGSLLIRAPQTAGNTDLQVNPINGTITGASSITVQGYTIFNAASSGGSIDSQEAAVFANSQTFTGNTAAIASRLLANNAGLASLLVVQPGAEIINPTGDLTLSSTWDLAPYRFGPDNVAGGLVLRAAGNIVLEFGASLTDGFDVTLSADGQQWDAPLLQTVGAPSWSYRITAGADFSGANYADLTPLANLAPGSGSVLIGQGAPVLTSSPISLRSQEVPQFFETIRTGAGSIAINAGRDVDLLDSLATIYSAGTQAPALANFTLPVLNYIKSGLGLAQGPFFPAFYTEYGGDVSISAQNDIAHLIDNGSGQLVADSSTELPDNWLYRQGAIDATTGQFTTATSWWSDFSNFFEGVASFGGGNVTLNAGHDVSNVDALVPTNARMPNGLPSALALVELGGGNLVVTAGNDINGGVYYVERGLGALTAGGQILTNSTRATVDQGTTSFDQSAGITPDPSTWLPTTLFAGDASFKITAGGDILMGPVANPFLLPQGINNNFINRSYFSTYAATDSIDVSSLSGDVTIKDSSDGTNSGSLESWLLAVDSLTDQNSFASTSQPWLKLVEPTISGFSTVTGLMPGTLSVTSFSGSINLVGTILLTPEPNGTLDMLAAGSINGLQLNAVDLDGLLGFGTGVIDLSDANPSGIPGVATPIAGNRAAIPRGAVNPLALLDTFFSETGSTEGAAGVIQTKEALHDPGLLHLADSIPAHLYAERGSISGLTLFSAKFTDVIAGQDITDASFYIQNDRANDISVISAGRDIIPFDPNSPLRLQAQQPGDELIPDVSTDTEVATGSPDAGDLQISGPGTLEVLAGRNLTAGQGNNNSDGTAVGITSIGNARNPFLPFEGAQVVVAAGLGSVADGLNESSLDIQTFVSQILSGPGGATYFADLALTEPGLDVTGIDQFNKLSPGQQAIVALDLFYLVLRDTGRNHNLAGNPGFGSYATGLAAVQALFSKDTASVGDIDLTSKEIKTESGGDIDIFDPAGQLTVGVELAGAQPVDQGILTDDGGNISIYTQGSVNLGTSRVFTLRGGNIIIWSNGGNIAAGESSKTVQSAPPTRVIVDPQSADVDTDLAGLATGGGIGVLAAVAGVPPGSVDLIAPTGVIDAGDAGIRSTGNLNLAAVQILNASNIQAGGATTGVPTVSVAAPNLAGLSAASSATGATAAAANSQANNASQQQAEEQGGDSVISVSVIGYGGGDSGDDGG